MDAALYFELVDAVARIDGQAGLVDISARISATDLHPLERRVLDRALRARGEALTLKSQLLIPDLFTGTTPGETSLVARG
ncbi:MAG TPA: hypothetical protein VM076_01705 [Gemmatimonadaceae bacterium]|nr:hypothetical protein [Gemmatimonadaceae bacterium]